MEECNFQHYINLETFIRDTSNKPILHEDKSQFCIFHSYKLSLNGKMIPNDYFYSHNQFSLKH